MRESFLTDGNALRAAFDSFQREQGTTVVAEIVINPKSVIFNTGVERFSYSRGSLSSERFESPTSFKDFKIADIDIDGIQKAQQTAIAWAAKNSYLKEPNVTNIMIKSGTVSRDANLVSNVGRTRDEAAYSVYVDDEDLNLKVYFVTNTKGDIVEIPTTNTKPRVKFMNEAQMKKSIGEIKQLFGGKLSVLDLHLQGEAFSFSAADPLNLGELNTYRFETQEFLTADKNRQSVSDVEANARQNRANSPFLKSKVFFDIDEIDFSILAKLEQKAIEASSLGRPKISAIRVAKFESGDGKLNGLIWTVDAYGDRDEKAVIEFDGKGDVIEAKIYR